MSNLPPELAELADQYAQIFDRFSAGQLTQEQALMTVESLVAVDGAGCTWRVNTDPSAADGEDFLRAMPGGAFAPCNPMYFQPLTTPAPQPQPSAPWEQTGGAPSWGAFGGADPQAAPAYGHPSVSSADTAASAPWAASPHATPAPSTKRRPGMPSLPVAGMVTKLTADKRRLIGVAVIVVGIVLFLASRGGDTDPADGSPDGAVPTVTVPVAPEPTPGPSPEPTPAPELTLLPADGDLARVRAALSSGQRETAVAVLVDQGSAHRQFMASAMWTGMSTVGVDVVAEPAVAGADGSVTQRWLLVDRVTAQPVSVATVVWVAVDGVWLLTGWPDIAAVG